MLWVVIGIAPHWNSNEYPQYMFLWRTDENYPSLSSNTLLFYWPLRMYWTFDGVIQKFEVFETCKLAIYLQVYEKSISISLININIFLVFALQKLLGVVSEFLDFWQIAVSLCHLWLPATFCFKLAKGKNPMTFWMKYLRFCILKYTVLWERGTIDCKLQNKLQRQSSQELILSVSISHPLHEITLRNVIKLRQARWPLTYLQTNQQKCLRQTYTVMNHISNTILEWSDSNRLLGKNYSKYFSWKL